MRYIYRPWGFFTDAERGDRFWLRSVLVLSGESTAYHFHRRHAEILTVVSGEASILIRGGVRELHPGQSILIPAKEVHMLSNNGPEPLLLAEVGVGEVDDADCVRVADRHGRMTDADLQP